MKITETVCAMGDKHFTSGDDWRGCCHYRFNDYIFNSFHQTIHVLSLTKQKKLLESIV